MNGIVELSGVPSLGGCAPCGMGAIEVIPPTFENGDDEEPSEVVPVQAATTVLVVGAGIVTLIVVGLIWVTRKA